MRVIQLVPRAARKSQLLVLQTSRGREILPGTPPAKAASGLPVSQPLRPCGAGHWPALSRRARRASRSPPSPVFLAVLWGLYLAFPTVRSHSKPFIFTLKHFWNMRRAPNPRLSPQPCCPGTPISRLALWLPPTCPACPLQKKKTLLQVSPPCPPIPGPPAPRLFLRL